MELAAVMIVFPLKHKGFIFVLVIQRVVSYTCYTRVSYLYMLYKESFFEHVIHEGLYLYMLYKGKGSFTYTCYTRGTYLYKALIYTYYTGDPYLYILYKRAFPDIVLD